MSKEGIVRYRTAVQSHSSRPGQQEISVAGNLAQPAAPPAQTIRLSYRGKVAVAAIVGLAAILFVYSIRHMLPPFILAIVAAYVFNPVVDWLNSRTHIPRALVVLVIYVALLSGLGWTIATVVPAIGREASELRDSYPRMLRSLEERFLAEEPVSFLGVYVDTHFLSNASNQILRDVPGGAVRVVSVTFRVLGEILIFLVATFYMLVDGHRIGRAVSGLIPRSHRQELLALGGEVNNVLGKYIRGQILLVALMTGLTWIVLSPILHLRFALLVSVMTGFLELFPIVGPITAGAIACSIGLFQVNPLGWEPWLYALVIVGVYTVLRHSEDYLVIPNVIGRITRLHPLVVLFALFSGATLGGILGMFIAVPVTAVLKILLQYVHRKLVEDPPTPEGTESSVP